MRHFAAVGDVSGITIFLGDFALVAAAKGDLPRAARLRAASDKLADQGGAQLGTVGSPLDDLLPEMTRLSPEALRAAEDEGRGMTLDQAVAYALEGDDAK